MNKISYFYNFLFESESIDDDKIKVVLLSNKSKDSHTIDFFKKELKSKKIEYRIINILKCEIIVNNDLILIDDNENKPFEISPNNTVILSRRGIVRNSNTKSILTELENKGFYVINSLNSIMNCEDKYTTYKLLKNNDLPTPKTYFLDNIDDLDLGVEFIGGKYPIIVKLLSGSQGIGVSILDSYESLKSTLQTIWKLSPEAEILIQEKIDTEYDIRVQVLNKTLNTEDLTDSIILGQMKRNKIEKDFRTNYSLGGTVDNVELTDDQIKIVTKASKVVGCVWSGVDIIVDKNTGKNYILEVNASPGTKGIMEAMDKNLVLDIINFMENKENWESKKSLHVGYREMIHVENIGNMVAKFDTGNGSLTSSITYDKIDVNEKTGIVKWKLGPKKFESKILGFSNTEVGDGRRKSPIIAMNITFNNIKYKNVEVALVDRSTKSTKFLINRSLMRRMHCHVNPNKFFIVTEKPENYSIPKYKKDPHGGIIFNK